MATDEELGQAGGETSGPDAAKSAAKPAWQRPLFIGLAALAVIGVALGVGLGVGLNNNNEGSAAAATSSSTGVGGGVEEQLTGKQNVSTDSPAAGPIDAPTSSDETNPDPLVGEDNATELDPAGATESDPDSSVGEINTTNPDPTGEGNNATSLTTNPDPTGEGNNATSTEPDPPLAEYIQEARSEFTFVSSTDDPIPITIRTIDDPTIMSGYSSCQELYDDIVNATSLLANTQILRNAEYIDRYNQYYPPAAPGVATGGFTDDVSMVAEDASAQKQPGAAAGSGQIDETSFESNNQEEDVDEADVVKSDGTYVYAGYGDVLVVWRADTGEELSRTRMPERKELSYEEGGCGGPYGGGGGPIGIDKVEPVAVPQQKSIWMPYRPRPRIQGMLLHSDLNRLVVIVSGYRPQLCYNYPDKPIMRDKSDVHVRIYDISPNAMPADGTSELTLLGEKEMWGSYRSARSIGGAAHIVVQSGLDFHSRLSQYLDSWRQEYRGLNKTEYIRAATEVSKDLIPQFAERLVGELQEISGGDAETEDCSAVTKISMFASGGKSEEGWPDVTTGSSGILNSYLQVASLDMRSEEFTELESTTLNNVKTAGAFFPNHWAEIYASEDVLVAAGEGYRHHPFDRSWEQTTYFLLFNLQTDGSAASGLAIGRAPGYVLNQFAMDQYEDTFRVATTTRAKWACVNQMKPPVQDGDGFVTIPEFWRCDWQQISESTSQITVMKFPEDGSNVMEEVKVLDNLGVTEVITSARFFDAKAYIVTFMQTDPVYTIDFSNPYDPEVTGELKITGFSSYLHPVGSDRLLGIGREADKDGRVTGFQITLFNVTDMTNTTVIQRFTIEQRWSSSVAERDHLAFRYLFNSKLLILPVSIYPYWHTKEEPFDGFQVYYVDDDGIEPRFNVSMADAYSMNYGCWYHATLPARSMVFSGKAMFMKGHTYQSWDLNDEDLLWEHNLDSGMTTNCYNYWR